MPINVIDALESDKQVDSFIVRREESKSGMVKHFMNDDIEREILKLPASNPEDILKKVRMREMKRLGRYRDIYEIKVKDMSECMKITRKREKEMIKEQMMRRGNGLLDTPGGVEVMGAQMDERYRDPLYFMQDYSRGGN